MLLSQLSPPGELSVISEVRDSASGTLECSILFIVARGRMSGLAECSYPPGEVGPVRVLAGRPGLDVRYLRAIDI